MLFKTEFQVDDEKLVNIPQDELEAHITKSISSELADFILSKKTPIKDAQGVYKTELFVTSKDYWLKLRKLLNMYGSNPLPYELEALLLAMEQQ